MDDDYTSTNPPGYFPRTTSVKVKDPSIPREVDADGRTPTSDANGFRNIDSCLGMGNYDIGDARTFGPKRAARLFSPLRDLKSRKLYRDMV